jgi:hypothetical protein
VHVVIEHSSERARVPSLGRRLKMPYDALKTEEPQTPWAQIQALKGSMRELEQASARAGLDFVAKRRQLERSIAQLEQQLGQEDAKRTQVE